MPLHVRESLDWLRRADLAAVKERLQEHPELARLRDESQGDAALQIAIARDDPALVALLIAAGADIHECTPALVSPYFVFVRSVPVAVVLDGAGARWAEHGAAALALVASRGDPALLEWLIARGSRPSAAAFHHARFDLELVRVLLPACVPNVRDSLLAECFGLELDGEERSAKMTASIVAELLRAGADPKASDALHRAASMNHVPAIELLLAAGDDPNRATQHGELAIVCAAYEGAYDAIRVLRAAGADVDRQNAHGQSARSAAQELEDPVLERAIESIVSK